MPWQSYFLSFSLGLFAFRYLIPACVALGILIVADTVLRSWQRRLPLLLFLSCAALGYGYGVQQAPQSVETPSWMTARRPTLIHGKVSRVEPRVGGFMRLVLSDIQSEHKGVKVKLPGRLVWTWRRPDRIPVPGQHVSAQLRLVPIRGFGNPGSWDYEWYWKRQGVLWRGWLAGRRASIHWEPPPDDFLWNMRVSVWKTLEQAVPKGQGGAVVRALLCGDRSGLQHSTLQATRAAGLSHALALSGLHVGFVAMIGLAIGAGISRLFPFVLLFVPRPYLAVLCAFPFVAGYAWLGQPSQSLIRAAIMFAFWGVLFLRGRHRVLLDGLFFSLFCIVIVCPFALFDLSLQMSAMAVAGISLLLPFFKFFHSQGRCLWQKVVFGVGGILVVSLCANVALLPLISRYFGTFTPNILMNVLWLPVLGCVVMPLGLAGVIFVVCPWTTPLGIFLLGGASMVMGVLLETVHWASFVACAPVLSVLRPLYFEILGYFVLLVVAIVAWTRRRVSLVLAGLGFAFLVGPHVFVVGSDAAAVVRLETLDVGLGQSLVVSTPGGHRWLIDGGNGSQTFDFGESVVAPTLTLGRPPRLDGVFLSHPDSDHSHGLPFILSHFDVGPFYSNGMLPRGRLGERFASVFAKRGKGAEALCVGKSVSLGRDLRLTVLHPPRGYSKKKANDRSLILRLEWKGRGLALLPGDVERRGLATLLAQGVDLSADVLVVPHHGSKSSYSPEFYQAVSPVVAVCSNGSFNRFGFPHKIVEQGIHAPMLTTSKNGWVECVWDQEGDVSVHAFIP